jgi:RNA polymerase sigma factor (sigma-70 family)
MRKLRETEPYKFRIEIVGDIEQITVSFTDGQGNEQEVGISRAVFTEMQHMQADENRQIHSQERYISHFIGSVSDDNISSISFYPIPTTEDTILRSELSEFISDIITSLSDVQRRRFIMRHIDGMTYREIAKAECCSKQSVHEAIRSAEKVFKKSFQKYYE